MLCLLDQASPIIVLSSDGPSAFSLNQPVNLVDLIAEVVLLACVGVVEVAVDEYSAGACLVGDLELVSAIDQEASTVSIRRIVDVDLLAVLLKFRGGVALRGPNGIFDRVHLVEIRIRLGLNWV